MFSNKTAKCFFPFKWPIVDLAKALRRKHQLCTDLSKWVPKGPIRSQQVPFVVISLNELR